MKIRGITRVCTRDSSYDRDERTGTRYSPIEESRRQPLTRKCLPRVIARHFLRGSSETRLGQYEIYISWEVMWQTRRTRLA